MKRKSKKQKDYATMSELLENVRKYGIMCIWSDEIYVSSVYKDKKPVRK